MLQPSDIELAYNRIAPFINETPILQSDFLNELAGGDLHFKFEGLQKTGAFKARGALNTLFSLKEQNRLPERIVALSSGNHAQAVAYAAKLLGVKAKIFIPEFSSKIKIKSTRELGAEVVLTKTRQEAEILSKADADNGAYLVHPYDDDMIICGQGTSCYEALKTGLMPDAIFVTIGGGGWISGSFLASKLLHPEAKVYGAEPLLGNDATQSYKSGSIVKLADTPKTIADGARTLAISERTFQYIKQLSGIYEIDEDEIIKNTQILQAYLKVTVEPTSAIAFAAAIKWLGEGGNKDKKCLIMLSGGNVDTATMQQIWANDYLVS